MMDIDKAAAVLSAMDVTLPPIRNGITKQVGLAILNLTAAQKDMFDWLMGGRSGIAA